MIESEVNDQRLGGRARLARGWFYSDAGRTIGPVSIEALTAALRQRPDPLNSLVWNSQVCGRVKDVPEVAELIFRPPDSHVA